MFIATYCASAAALVLHPASLHPSSRVSLVHRAVRRPIACEVDAPGDMEPEEPVAEPLETIYQLRDDAFRSTGSVQEPVASVPVDVEDSSEYVPPKRAVSWQEELETLLDPGTPQGDREMMLKDLVARAPEISEEVQEALNSGDLSSLLPEESKSKQLAEDIATVQRQVLDDILPQAANEVPSLLESVVREAPALAQDAAQRGPALLSLLQDPARAFNLVQREVRNTVTRTPEGQETPPYRAVRDGEGYQVRAYETYKIVATTIAEGESELVAGSRGFNSLTSFILGGNANGETLEMMTPVRIDVGPSATRMAFPLPTGASAPTDGAVRLESVAAQQLAVKEFTGFATAAEVRRQLDTLLRQLQREGLAMQDPSGREYVVLQYNPPYTLPWLRRNEVGLALVDERAAAASSVDAEPQAVVEEVVLEEEEDDSAPSD